MDTSGRSNIFSDRVSIDRSNYLGSATPARSHVVKRDPPDEKEPAKGPDLLQWEVWALL